MAGLAVVLLFTLTTLLHHGSAQTEMEPPWSNTVFILKPEESQEQIAKVRMQFNEEQLTPGFSVCMWLWPLFTSPASVLFSVYDADTTIAVKALEGNINGVHFPMCPVPFLKLHLLPNTWQHLCLVVANSTTRIHLGNMTSSRVLDADDCKFISAPTESVGVQVGSKSGELTYSGQVTGVRYYNRPLTPPEVNDLQNCNDSPVDYVQMTDISINGNVSYYSLKKQQELCRPEAKEFVALFPICTNHQQAKKLCATFGGRLMNESDNFKEIAKDVELSQDDVEEIQLSLWTDITKQKQGQAMSVNKRTGFETMLPFNYDIVFKVTACMMPHMKTVYKKCDTTKAMSLFQYNRRLVVVSKRGEVISRERCFSQPGDKVLAWCLVKRSVNMPDEFAFLLDEKDIFSRALWMEENQIESRNVSLTFCEEDKFTCNDATCIPLSKRCDGTPDCEDNSDEAEQCRTLIKALPSTYSQDHCPGIVIGLKIKSLKMISVMRDSNQFKVNLVMELIWRDARLTFENLQQRPVILDSEKFIDIWIPDIALLLATYENNKAILNMNSEPNTFRAIPRTTGHPEIQDTYEVMRFNGSEVDIIKAIDYEFTQSCSFDFVFFPFDIQECEIKIALKSTTWCKPDWDRREGKLKVHGKESTLSMYSISRARYRALKEHKTVTVKLLFTRKFDAYVMTTFVPCVILCVLAHTTLIHFKLENFNDRIMVTLSLLIVLASLFSQLSSTLPSSPSAKLVDYFFLYCIMRVSFIFLLHSFIEASLRSTADKEEETQATIKGTDPTLGIHMKLAWVPGDNGDTKEPPKRRYNIPRIINNLGSIGLLMVDVVMIVLVLFKTGNDHNEKLNRFNAWNITPEKE